MLTHLLGKILYEFFNYSLCNIFESQRPNLRRKWTQICIQSLPPCNLGLLYAGLGVSKKSWHGSEGTDCKCSSGRGVSRGADLDFLLCCGPGEGASQAEETWNGTRKKLLNVVLASFTQQADKVLLQPVWPHHCRLRWMRQDSWLWEKPREASLQSHNYPAASTRGISLPPVCPQFPLHPMNPYCSDHFFLVLEHRYQMSWQKKKNKKLHILLVVFFTFKEHSCLEQAIGQKTDQRWTLDYQPTVAHKFIAIITSPLKKMFNICMMRSIVSVHLFTYSLWLQCARHHCRHWGYMTGSNFVAPSSEWRKSRLPQNMLCAFQVRENAMHRKR